ncbi:hypothetical protein JRQ81_001131, partial [Phrynocephalus forsythii]
VFLQDCSNLDCISRSKKIDCSVPPPDKSSSQTFETMCRKTLKLAWDTEPNTIDQLKKTLDYKFLELLVLFESRSNISDRLKKAEATDQSCNQQFLDQLRPLLKSPDGKLAQHVRDLFYPNLREEPTQSKRAFISADDQRITSSKKKTIPPRSKSAPALRSVEPESWTMVTPVPHISCPCYPQRTYTPVITEEDLMAVERGKTDIYFKMQTSETKRIRYFQQKMDSYISEYGGGVALKKQHPPRPKSVPSMQRPSTTRKVSRGTNRFENLSAPRRRFPFQSFSEAAAGEAYKRGVAMPAELGEPRSTALKWARKLGIKEPMESWEFTSLSKELSSGFKKPSSF